jgi:hypothetical protein
MPSRKRPGRPVEIVLTEEDLAVIIQETARSARPPAPSGGTWRQEAEGEPAREGFGVRAGADSFGGGDPSFDSIADRVWRHGVARPGALDEAIRRILEATTLDRGKPTTEEE